jgi:hypothetical protein
MTIISPAIVINSPNMVTQNPKSNKSISPPLRHRILPLPSLSPGPSSLVDLVLFFTDASEMHGTTLFYGVGRNAVLL